jgi:hypothetical protein
MDMPCLIDDGQTRWASGVIAATLRALGLAYDNEAPVRKGNGELVKKTRHIVELLGGEFMRADEAREMLRFRSE